MTQRSADVVRRDESLRTAVMAELDWHALVDASQLDVSVEAAVVTVVGSVSSIASKLIVLDTIESIAGVSDVISEIVVLSSGVARPDEDLDTVVGQFLAWDALVPEASIRHRVSDGWVTLSGDVATARQRDEAERAVSHIVGIRGVTNDIDLVGSELSPTDIRATIVSALERRAQHAAQQIDVIVDGHTVTLRGAVGSQRQKRAIVGAVSHAAGVEVLCDDLHVRRVS